MFKSFGGVEAERVLDLMDERKDTGIFRAFSTRSIKHNNSSGLRALDLTVAIAALVFLAPLMAVIALAIWITGGGPLLYRHARLGRDGTKFWCVKFRSMHTDGDRILADHLTRDPEACAEWARDRKLRNDPRISTVGRFLRKTSLDELPQLFNVLAGDMSIVGPRPIVEAEIPLYGHYIQHYYAVRPGITGLWQVSGRNNTSYRRRVACDVSYVRSKSAGQDLRIMAMTVPVVLLAKGAY